MPSNASANRRMSGHHSTSGGIEAVGKLIGELASSGAELVSINLEARVGKEEENLPGRGRHATRTAPPSKKLVQYNIRSVLRDGTGLCYMYRELLVLNRINPPLLARRRQI